MKHPILFLVLAQAVAYHYIAVGLTKEQLFLTVLATLGLTVNIAIFLFDNEE